MLHVKLVSLIKIKAHLPGIIATVLSARKTRNVRRAARFPKSIPMVM